MIFMYCNWVSSQWQWSGDLYKKGNRQHKRGNNTHNSTKIQNTQIENKKQTKIYVTKTRRNGIMHKMT